MRERRINVTMMPDLANSCKPIYRRVDSGKHLGARLLVIICLFLGLFVSYYDAEDENYSRKRSQEKEDRRQSRITKNAEGRLDAHHQGGAYDQSRQHQSERDPVRDFLKPVEHHLFIDRINADL